MICCSCGKEIDINYGREYWNGIYCKKCADEMLSTPEYIKNYKRIIADLQAENAAMRKQISEMLTPLCTLGDKLYHLGPSFRDDFDKNGNVIQAIVVDIIETEVTRDNIWLMCDLVQNKRAFFSREALAASFKERFEKESD